MPKAEKRKENKLKMSGNINLVGKNSNYIALNNNSARHGGNGVVYDLINCEEFVAKVLYSFNGIKQKDRLFRFNKEIEFLKNHKNIHLPVLIDEYSKNDENVFFVMKKYLTIDSIYNGNFSYYDLIDFCLQLLEAVEYIHSTGAAHRDIKPKNILFEAINDKYNLILSDYGLIGDDCADSPGDWIGSYSFTPPELMFRNVDTDSYFASDVYEFAKTVYAVLNRKFYSFNDGIYLISENLEINTGKSDGLFLEPIYELIERSVRYSMSERPNLNEWREAFSIAKSLINGENHAEWRLKRKKRRALCKLIEQPYYMIKNSDKIYTFLQDYIDKGYDIEWGDDKHTFDNANHSFSIDNEGNKIDYLTIFCTDGTKISIKTLELIINSNNKAIIELNAHILDNNLKPYKNIIKIIFSVKNNLFRYQRVSPVLNFSKK